MGEQIQKTTLITVYSAGVAACYLAGFWGRFDVNIFQFAGLTGFASMALYPLMTAIGLNFLVIVSGFSGGNAQPAAPALTRPKVARPWKAKLYKTWFALGPVGTMFSISLISASIKWMVVLAWMIPWIMWVADNPIVMKLISGPSRKRVVYWLIALPIFATQAGASQAEDFLDGRGGRTVAPTGAAKDLQWDSHHPIGYLGFAGGTYFLFESKTGNVVMINQAVSAPLTLLKSSTPTTLTWLREIFHHENQ
ncbi:hypothetical protein K6W21_01475 [Burkholderia latens]|uniref:hypothetical protein n=1 Tax=Burkholderia latens TaxID=488446 RepID=UPI001C97DEC0|nr:hypothetical protein [Burkholderia latens]MBY4692758.1 hypothetical protein [Burkholderia latens]